MILIADSGSTKTDWRLIEETGKIHPFETPGINPFFQDTPDIMTMLEKQLLPHLHGQEQEVEQFFFYGAGCGTLQKREELKALLNLMFKKAEVLVETDMTGAARALCGNESGIACILGTGSNSCYFDGKTVCDTLPSYGFMFGDYGSGAHIGKTLIERYFQGHLPPELKKNFEARRENTRENILEQVYRKPYPNRYLASFSKFVFQNKDQPYMVHLLKDCFHLFFEKQVEPYAHCRELPIHAVGSVAYYYSSLIKAVAEERELKIGNILASPIAALTLYHKGED